MIPTAVRPLARPRNMVRTIGFGIVWGIGETGYSRRASATQAEIMKMPSPAPSLKYSDQCSFSAAKIGLPGLGGRGDDGCRGCEQPIDRQRTRASQNQREQAEPDRERSADRPLRLLACQDSPSDQSEMPSRARSLMRN